jgi:hypothetical protein
MRQLDKGASLTDLAIGFMAAPEFASKYGNLSDSQFIVQLYRNVLHRDPDSGGLDFWTQHLMRHDLSRAETVVQFSESFENGQNMATLVAQGIVYDYPAYMAA